MSFQTPITIKQALQRIERHEYALPAIQREFVWTPEQISALFDSLLRGYPIGSFLFWTVEASHSREFKFYDFVQHYHERDNPHCPALNITEPRKLTAILDGQQRLTAFNIALRGSMANKEPRKWKDNPDAYPRKRLCLNLAREAEVNEANLRFDFRFLTDLRAAERTPEEAWFPVPRILEFANAGPAINSYLKQRDLAQDERAFQTLYELYGLVHDRATISHFLEEEQDLDKVLNIFIRVNSGATKLSYSDLLMSISTAQWSKIDAREAVIRLVDELNGIRDGFEFSKDFVLKAGLMLSDIASVGFKVTNFNTKNMTLLESKWDGIAKALRLTVGLAADFGLSRQTLSADSALLPIAYYLHRRQLGEPYRTQSKYSEDRQAIRGWLVRTLVKSGVWGAGLDTTLTAIRSMIEKHGTEYFPVAEIEAEMARRGRSLKFTKEEIQDLAELPYGDRRCFAMLSLLYPFVDLRNLHHIDHVFPKARFTKKKLLHAGVPEAKLEDIQCKANLLPNLQLLPGTQNQEKNDSMPAEWLVNQFKNGTARKEYSERHDLGELPEDFDGFEAFYMARRARLHDRIRASLG
jgi:hypothetical protein